MEKEELPMITITLKNGEKLKFYKDNNYNLKEISNVINNAGKCVYIENTLIMKDEISYLEIY